jgi:acetylornithine deacetylase
VALIGEPSRMKVITGHKGGTGYAVHVKGYEVHSSLLPEGVSAVMEAARLIQWVNDYNDLIQSMPRGPIGARFHPPFTTLHVGRIQGGTADNITAADCRFSVEMRCVPDDDPETHAGAFREAATALDRALQARRPEAGVSLTKFFDVSPLRPEVDGEAEALARALTGENATGVVSYGTEAGQFQDAGYSAVVCGPGDIAQAHQADEYLEVSEFQAGQRFMERLLERLA